MTDEEFAALVVGDDDRATAQAQTSHAQACLDLFEKDRGRCAVSVLELRNWADVHDPETLRFRIRRRLDADQAWTKAVKRIWVDIPKTLASRPPIGQRIMVNLTQAAALTGKSEDAIFAAIAHGRLPGKQDMHDVWHVERADLLHLFPPHPTAPGAKDAVPLDAAALLLEVGISALVRKSGDKLRRRRLWWRRAG